MQATTTSTRSSSWLWLLALFALAGFIETAFFGQMNAFVPLYLPKLGVAQADVALWTSLSVIIANAVGIPFIPLWGALADRYSRQPIIVRSFVVHVIAVGLMLVARNIWLFILGRTFMNFALGNSGLMMTTLSESTPSNRQGLAFSLLNGALPIGAFVGPLVGGYVLDRQGFQTVLVGMGGLMVFLVLALSFGYHDSFKGTNRGSIPQMAWESVKLIWQSARLRSLFLALFIFFSGWTMGLIYVPLVVAKLYTGDNLGQVVGLVFGVSGLITLLVSPLVGSLADRFGHVRVLFVFAILEICLWPIPGLTHTLVFFAATWAILSGVASGVFALSFSIMSSSATPQARGRVMSFAYLPINAASLLGPALGSLVAGTNIFYVFPIAAGFAAVGLGLLALAIRYPVEARL